MRITQSDFRTVRIEKGSLIFFIRYSLYWNGQKRLPESTVSREDHVIAYFLTSKIRDCILETESGLSIERSWSVLQEGEITLSFCLDFPFISAPYLFPCIDSGTYVGKETIHVSGEQTVYPCSLFLYSEPDPVLIFSDPPKTKAQSGSLGMKRILREEEPFLRVELHFPPDLQQEDSSLPNREKQTFHSNGNFEYSLRLNLVASPPEEIHRKGISTALNRFKESLHPPQKPSTRDTQNRIENSIKNCLSHFLVTRGGICGLRTEADSSTLSSYAGAGLSLIMNKFFIRDRIDSEMLETSLRLADFSLKGQHPSGLFFETFDLEDNSWKGSNQKNIKKGSEIEPTVSVEMAASISGFLIQLVKELKSKDLRGEKYFWAAARMINALFDSEQRLSDYGSDLLADSLHPVKHELGVLELIKPLWELYKITGRDRYRKALLTLKEKYFPNTSELVPLPTSEQGTEPDSKASLLLAQSAIILTEAGLQIKNLKRYFSLLLPWIHINFTPLDDSFNSIGGTCDSLSRGCLLFQGYEFAYALLKLERLISRSKLSKLVKTLANQLIGFTSQKPMGTSSFNFTQQKNNNPFGPLDSKKLVREAYYLQRIQEEFPALNIAKA